MHHWPYAGNFLDKPSAYGLDRIISCLSGQLPHLHAPVAQVDETYAPTVLSRCLVH